MAAQEKSSSDDSDVAPLRLIPEGVLNNWYAHAARDVADEFRKTVLDRGGSSEGPVDEPLYPLWVVKAAFQAGQADSLHRMEVEKDRVLSSSRAVERVMLALKVKNQAEADN